MNRILEQFSSAFEAVPTALLVVDDRGRIVLANADLNKLFGYEAGELIGQPVEVLLPAEFRENHPGLREAFEASPQRRTMGSGRDLYGLTKSGDLIPVEIGLNSVRTDQGNYSVASVADMSAKVAEQKKTRRAIDAAGSAMIMVDRDGRIVLTNSAACEMFNVEHDKLLGIRVEQLVPERFRHRHVAYRTGYSAKPSTRSMVERRNMFCLRADGTEFPAEIGLTPIDHDGQCMTMATIIDITDRVRTEQEIQRQNDVLTSLNDDLTQFAYSASHDLKAPLATLEGLLGCLIEDVNGENSAEAIVNAERAKLLAKRLGDLIESTLGLAQSGSGDVDDCAPVNLTMLVDHIRNSLGALFERHDVELRTRIPAGCPLLTHGTRVRQIIENLLSNSVKYSDPAKAHRYVDISAEYGAETIQLTVDDNGVGIPPESHQDVFKRFRRFGDHDAEGTGVGLALVKQHVNRLNGQITFTSSTEGTRFQVVLPVILTNGDSIPTDQPRVGDEPKVSQ